MKREAITVFLSCSFEKQDKKVVDFIKAICVGMEMQCINVDKASPQVPSDEARKQIQGAKGLIGVVTRRKQAAGGEWLGPASVRDEIAFAFALNKPLLLLVEDNVTTDGFIATVGTWVNFNRSTLTRADFVEKLSGSLYEFRYALSAASDSIDKPELHDYISELTVCVTNLQSSFDRSSYYWTQSITKRLKFNVACRNPIRFGCWSTKGMTIPEDAQPMEVELVVNASSRPFKVNQSITEQTASAAEGSFSLTPSPTEGDFLEYTSRFRTRWLYPLFEEDIGQPNEIVVDGKTFSLFDGMVPIQSTRRMKIIYRFPAEYPLSRDDLRFYVGTYSTTLKFVVPHEMTRSSPKIETIGGELTLEVVIENPLLSHMYGVAWNPPQRGR